MRKFLERRLETQEEENLHQNFICFSLKATGCHHKVIDT